MVCHTEKNRKACAANEAEGIAIYSCLDGEDGCKGQIVHTFVPMAILVKKVMLLVR